MNIDPEQIAKLLQLSQLKLNIDLADLSRINQEEKASRQVLDKLAQAQKTQLRFSTNNVDDNVFVANQTAHQNWTTWAEGKQRESFGTLAKISENREVCITSTRRALGRVDVLEKIIEALKN